MQFKGPAIAPEELADLWINGYYLRNDTDKNKRLNGLFGDLTPAKVNFLTYLINATRSIDHLGHLVAEGYAEKCLPLLSQNSTIRPDCDSGREARY